MPPEPACADIEDFQNKRVTVMGLGLAGGGVGSARFFSDAGAQVTVTDLRGEDDLSESVSALAESSVEFHLGGHREQDFVEADLVVASPAVPPDSSFVSLAASRGVRVESALTLFFRWCPARIVGVTGTLGKTTVTAMIGSILSRSRLTSWVGGNIGRNPLAFVREVGKDDVVVLEISSFQLEYLGRAGFSPPVAVVTGISPDHMDRYRSMEEYALAKRNILRFQAERDVAFLNGGYPEVLEWASDSPGEIHSYGVEVDGVDLRVCGTDIVFRDEVIGSVGGMTVGGRHNIENAAVSAGVCRWLDVGREVVDGGLVAFRGVPHRIEYVAEIAGTTFYDDSAATTPGAVVAALRAVETPIALILGGYDKGLDMSCLLPACIEKVEKVVLIGDSAATLAGMFEKADGEYRCAAVARAGSLDEAVAVAASAVKGGSVLLSPGYASFDMFRNYRERGEKFKQSVYALAEAAR